MKVSVIQLDSDLFKVKSKSDENLFYIVDMSIGTCECYIGSDGSPCWHQFILWSNGMATSSNFLPHFDKFERKKYAEIAIGSSLETSYYDPLHSIADKNNEDIPDLTENYSKPNSSVAKNDNILKSTKPNEKIVEALSQFELFSENIVEEVKKGDNEFNSSLIKFMNRYTYFTRNQKISSFHSFGSTFFGRRRSKIKVQPTAVSRRKSGRGSRNKQSTLKHRTLPNRPISLKRKHNITDAINSNVPSAKKAGRSMISNTKCFKKRTTK